MEAEIAIKFNGELGAMLAKTAAGAHLKVTMKWGDIPDKVVVTNLPEKSQ